MTTEAVGKLLGFRHTARRRLRRAVCEEREGAGVAGAGCEGAARASDAVSAPPSGKCGGGAWPWGAHPREAMEERVPSSSTGTNYYRVYGSLCYFVHFYATPCGYPDASTHTDTLVSLPRQYTSSPPPAARTHPAPISSVGSLLCSAGCITAAGGAHLAYIVRR